MKTLNLGDIFEAEKFEKLFYRYFIILLLGMSLLIFSIVVDAIISTAFTDRICVIVATTDLILFAPFPLGIVFRIFLATKQSPNKHKIAVTNNFAEISANKSDEMKYTEKEVIEIINGLVKNRDHFGNNSTAISTSYARSSIYHDDWYHRKSDWDKKWYMFYSQFGVNNRDKSI